VKSTTFVVDERCFGVSFGEAVGEQNVLESLHSSSRKSIDSKAVQRRKVL
jgi:hypothetical protein